MLAGRDAHGSPTGLLADAAMALVSAHIPPPSLEERRRAFVAATQHALSKGITSVGAAGAPLPPVQLAPCVPACLPDCLLCAATPAEPCPSQPSPTWAQALALPPPQVHDMGRVAFIDGEEAAWDDLENIYAPAADAGELPLRLYSFVPLPTWCVLGGRAGLLACQASSRSLC